MKKHEQMIEGTRAVIQSLELQQNEIYQRMVDELNPSEEQEGWLWDYCFNCKGESDSDYFKMVKGHVYGDNG